MFPLRTPKAAPLICMLLLCSAAIVNASTARSATVNRFDIVSSVGGAQGRGLALFEMGPGGMVLRFLLETPAGQPVVLTKTVDPRRGAQTVRLLDDASGWWVELTIDFGLPSSDLDEFLAKGIEDPWVGPVGLALRTSTAVHFEEPAVPTRDGATDYELFARRLVSAGLAAKLAASVPAGALPIVSFLDAAVSRDPAALDGFAYAWRGLLDILAAALAPQPPAGAVAEQERWTVEAGPARQGRGLSDPEDLEFVSRFRSVENSDPLSDHHVEDVPGRQSATGAQSKPPGDS